MFLQGHNTRSQVFAW